MTSSEGRFEIDVGAKARAGSLRVRLEGASWASPVGTSGLRVSASFRARFRTVVLRATLNLLHVLNSKLSYGTRTTSDQTACSAPYPRRPAQTRSRLRKLWFRIRGKRDHESVTGKALVTNTHLNPPTKPKWRLLLLKSRSSEYRQVTPVETPPQEPVYGLVEQYVGGVMGTGRVDMAVHGLGMVCTVIVLVQLAGAGGLPLLVAVMMGLVVVARVVFVNRYSSFDRGFQQLWREVFSIGGLTLVPQAFRVMFRPFFRQSSFFASEGIVGCFALVMILLARYRVLPFKVMQFFGVVIPAIFVFWAPIAQLWTCWWQWTCWWRPANVNFVQTLTGLLAVLSNCFLGYSESQKQHEPLEFLHKL